MATTPNFNWSTPDNTGLVKNGALDIRTLGNSIDASMAELKGGTTGQVLSKTSNTDMDFTWVAQDDSNAIQNALLTTTGDTIYASGASTPARRAIGTTGQVLTVSGGVPVWATPASGTTFVGCSITRTNQSTSVTNATNYMVAFNTENYDTDGFHDNTTNNSRITIPTGKGGKYLINMNANNAFGTVGSYVLIRIYLNGSQLTTQGIREGQVWSIAGQANASAVITLSAGDYIEMGYQQNNTETQNMWFIMSATYLGA
jgi:hypothetical protein